MSFNIESICKSACKSSCKFLKKTGKKAKKSAGWTFSEVKTSYKKVGSFFDNLGSNYYKFSKEMPKDTIQMVHACYSLGGAGGGGFTGGIAGFIVGGPPAIPAGVLVGIIGGIAGGTAATGAHFYSKYEKWRKENFETEVLEIFNEQLDDRFIDSISMQPIRFPYKTIYGDVFDKKTLTTHLETSENGLDPYRKGSLTEKDIFPAYEVIGEMLDCYESIIEKKQLPKKVLEGLRALRKGLVNQRDACFKEQENLWAASLEAQEISQEKHDSIIKELKVTLRLDSY